MKAKSNCMVLAVSNDDPATTHGATNVLLNMKKYTPVISPCGEVSLRTEVNGDQGFCERFRQAVYSRTEEDAEHRLSCLLPLPQDWHAQKVDTYPLKIDHSLLQKRCSWQVKFITFYQENLTIFRSNFDLPNQLEEKGSIANIKEVLSRTKEL